MGERPQPIRRGTPAALGQFAPCRELRQDLAVDFELGAMDRGLAGDRRCLQAPAVVMAVQSTSEAAVWDSDTAPCSSRTLSTTQRISLPSRSSKACGSGPSVTPAFSVPYQTAPTVTRGTVRCSRSPTTTVDLRASQPNVKLRSGPGMGGFMLKKRRADHICYG